MPLLPRLPRLFALGVLLVGALAVLWTLLDDEQEPSLAEVRAESGAAPASTTSTPPAPIPVLGEAMTLTDLDGWLNTEASSLEEVRAANELTVVQFWTFACRNCKNTLDALSDIRDEFGDRGVEIVGVHAPEFAFEAEVDNIVEAAAELGVEWPIALDTDKRNFHAWQDGPTGYWPRVYLIDAEGRVRLDERGDGTRHYVKLADYIERLLDGEA